MNNQTSLKAIKAALNSSWIEAISLNKQILKNNPKDIGALNRLGFAYLETEQIIKSQAIYKKVLLLDPYNPIAIRNIKRIIDFHKRKGQSCKGNQISAMPMVFLEEPGKTKVISLVKIASKSVLSQFRPCDPLIIQPKKHFIVVVDTSNKYVGILPDDISFKLLDLISKGNKYDAYVRSVSKNSIIIFLKEVFRSPKIKNISSFSKKSEICSHKQPNKNIDYGKDEEAEEKIITDTESTIDNY